jgi:nucleoside phosphorylase
MAQGDGAGDRIDFGVISVREDEYRAVCERFGPLVPRSKRNRTYMIAEVTNAHGEQVRLALVRSPEQGPGPAQETTRDLIDDLDPQWIVVVGIAGAIPDGEYTLGDVVVASRLHAFTVGAYLDGKEEVTNQGGPMTKQVQDLVALLPALRELLSGWETQKALGVDRPFADIGDPNNYYGDKQWREKTRKALEPYFGNPPVRASPIVTTRAVAAGGKLVKDTKIARTWLGGSRDIRAVEMELDGVYAAARQIQREYPVLAIRGISDIVGFDRDPRWTPYACQTAASFFNALVCRLKREELRLAPPESGVLEVANAPHTTDSRFVGPLEVLFGIDDLAKTLLDRLRTPGLGVIGLHGIGGVGKSSLAYELARRALDEELVVDVLYRSSARAGSDGARLKYEDCFKALADRMRLPNTVSAKELSETLRRPPILLFIDNLETSAEPQDRIVAQLCDLLEGTAARVLLTSRQAFPDARVHDRHLTGISELACGELVRHLGSYIPGVATIGGAELQAIYAATGGVPMAIRLIVPQFATESLDRVLGRLALVNPASLEGVEDDEYVRFYRSIIDWSWDALWAHGEADGRAANAATLLLFLANLPPTRSGAADVPTLAALSRLSEAHARRAIELLRRFSLVEVTVPLSLREERRFFTHPLVQQYVLSDMLAAPDQ